jgi:hypothetical protein
MSQPLASRSARLLFIGNSFTQRNNVPGLLAEMAAERGIKLAHELISRGGASLRNHWNAGAAERITSGRFDFVVLQEQSTLPIKNPNRMAENVRLFDPMIKQAGAQTVLYMTWARKHSPETQEGITRAYTSIGQELGAITVPVGLAWQRFRARHDQPELYDRDESHPTLAGSYLAACVFLAVLFGQNPIGIEAESKKLERNDGKLLQTTAWEAARHAHTIEG